MKYKLPKIAAIALVTGALMSSAAARFKVTFVTGPSGEVIGSVTIKEEGPGGVITFRTSSESTITENGETKVTSTQTTQTATPIEGQPGVFNLETEIVKTETVVTIGENGQPVPEGPPLSIPVDPVPDQTVTPAQFPPTSEVEVPPLQEGEVEPISPTPVGGR
jgi:hypothetical protein